MKVLFAIPKFPLFITIDSYLSRGKADCGYNFPNIDDHKVQYLLKSEIILSPKGTLAFIQISPEKKRCKLIALLKVHVYVYDRSTANIGILKMIIDIRVR